MTACRRLFFVVGFSGGRVSSSSIFGTGGEREREKTAEKDRSSEATTKKRKRGGIEWLPSFLRPFSAPSVLFGLTTIKQKNYSGILHFENTTANSRFETFSAS
jgi:hypothetical protein